MFKTDLTGFPDDLGNLNFDNKQLLLKGSKERLLIETTFEIQIWKQDSP